MKIAEVSRKYHISIDTLRYYERAGLIPAVNRAGNGIRDYDETDLRRVEFIQWMRRAGLPIETLTDYMKLVLQGDETIEVRKEILKEQRKLLASRIDEMRETMRILDYKIRVYEDAILAKEKNLSDQIKEEI